MNSPQQHPGRNDISAVILAGGKGSRVEGRDKGLLPLHGIPLVSRVISKLSPQVKTIFINANRNIEIYQQFGFEVFADDIDGHQGPLAGILAALERTESSHLLVVPCDAPTIPADLAARLADALAEQQKNIAVVDDGQRMQQMFLLIDASLRNNLHEFFERGGRAVKDWLDRHEPALADFADCPWAFANINSDDDLQRVARDLQ